MSDDRTPRRKAIDDLVQRIRAIGPQPSYKGLVRDVDVADGLDHEGWRPPARVIETLEELATLPAGSIVHRNDLMGGSYAFQRYDDEPGWMPTSWESEPIDSADVPLPVTVLFESEEGQ